MNRRDFTKSLAAFGLAPALPMAASAPASAGFTPYMYGLGAHLARSRGALSADMLARKLRLAPEAARAMQAQLARNGIIGAPNAAGVAMAAQPYMRGIHAAVSSAPALAEAVQRRALDTLDEAISPGPDADADEADSVSQES